MSKPVIATETHIEAIKQMAFNAAAIEMRMCGVRLTNEQSDEIDAEGHDWLRQRLGLNAATDDSGVTYSV